MSHFLAFSLSDMHWPLDSVFRVNLKLSALRDEHGFPLSIWIFTSCHSLTWLSCDLLSFCCLAFITHKFHTTRHISAFVISFHCSNICVMDLQKCNTLLLALNYCWRASKQICFCSICLQYANMHLLTLDNALANRTNNDYYILMHLLLC